MHAGASSRWTWEGRTQAGIVNFTAEALADFSQRELELVFAHELMFGFVRRQSADFSYLARRIQRAVEEERIGQEILLDAYSKEILIGLVRQYENNARIESYPAAKAGWRMCCAPRATTCATASR